MTYKEFKSRGGVATKPRLPFDSPSPTWKNASAHVANAARRARKAIASGAPNLSRFLPPAL